VVNIPLYFALPANLFSGEHAGDLALARITALRHPLLSMARLIIAPARQNIKQPWVWVP
jgi:hypothetical protein